MAFAYKATITVDYTKVPSTQTDFPVLVALTDTTLKTVANGGQVQNANGYDIRFYSDSSLTAALSFELESYTGTTGAIVFWVKIPSLSSSSPTVFYMGYGDASLNTNASSTAVWDTNFKGVWHLKDGSSLVLTDSTANAANGTNVNTVTPIAGQVDGAAHFVAASSQLIVGTMAHVSLPATLRCWFKLTNTGNHRAFIATAEGATNNGMRTKVNDANNPGFTLGGVADYAMTAAVTSGTWYYFSADINANNGTVNHRLGTTGSLTTESAAIGTLSGTNNIDFAIGARSDNSGDLMNGDIDEVRISNVQRSADWITTEFNNEKDVAAFLSASYAATVPAIGYMLNYHR